MAKRITLNTKKQVMPMVYAYSTPQIAEHNGWTKIGYTEDQTVEDRVYQQTHTANVEAKIEWKGTAIFDDGSGERFTDHDFHAFLRKQGVENIKKTEWYHVDGPTGHQKYYDFRSSRGVLKALDVVPYELRKEQADAVERTFNYFIEHDGGEFLWNAKPRFGKTLALYDLCKQMDAKKVLIVTNRPAIANSWYSDYVKFLGEPSGYKFVSETDSLRGQPYVLTRDEFTQVMVDDNKPYGCIEFLSLQDLKGSKYFGGVHDKLKELKDIEWDILVVDEAHEGVDTLKTDVAFDRIKRKYTVHLSGTPFKALANDKFEEKAIFNWTYADEQKEKRDWNGADGKPNPYAALPRLNLFTYQMSEIIRDELERGIEIQGETEEYAFDLNEFFETENGRFKHNASVDRFLDALTTQEKFPFSTEDLRNELKHTFWLLNRVESAKALAKKLQEHPVFSQYEIVLAAGDGRLEDAEVIQKAFDKVNDAIKTHDKTITISVGQLTTGVTIPEWTGVLMLNNLKSPALYMQAAFRSQNPWSFHDGTVYYRKENAYVFDFDPARTLMIFEEFANDLSTTTASGKGDSDTRKAHVRELLNFFPVIGEDESGEMIELDAEKVLSIPRKIRSQEVVRHGFMSNYLFQNISGVFGAPAAVMQILQKMTPVQEPTTKAPALTSDTAEALNINPDTGDVEIPDETVIGTAIDVFGPAIYVETSDDDIHKMAQTAFEEAQKKKDPDESLFETFKNECKSETVDAILLIAKEHYADKLGNADAKRLKKGMEDRFDRSAQKIFEDYKIEKHLLEDERLDALQHRNETGKTTSAIEDEFSKKKQEASEKFAAKMKKTANEFAQAEAETVVRTIETKDKERQKDCIADEIRNHLRGFSRTIPSFLMAYGDEDVTLSTFDQIIPDGVFVDVTSISLDEFRFLRDGGSYTDQNTGEERQFAGNLFDRVVFDDSVKEFLRLKKKLADYFNEKNLEDIFDYIPPQKTNQIFTPKVTVKQMVDYLEQENPGCFDDPDKTFIDLYMKSGLYITEIVKRLYQSKKMCELFPDGKERLKHIFEKQVYGLAPTEIIYRIATAYILGFDETQCITEHHFKQFDALPYAKEGTLQEKLDELFDKSL